MSSISPIKYAKPHRSYLMPNYLQQLQKRGKRQRSFPLTQTRKRRRKFNNDYQAKEIAQVQRQIQIMEIKARLFKKFKEKAQNTPKKVDEQLTYLNRKRSEFIQQLQSLQKQLQFAKRNKGNFEDYIRREIDRLQGEISFYEQMIEFQYKILEMLPNEIIFVTWYIDFYQCRQEYWKDIRDTLIHNLI